MQIKKSHIIVAITGILVSACSQDQPSDSSIRQEILLEGETVSATQSRSTQALPDDYTMVVHSIYHSHDGNSHSYFFLQEEFLSDAGVWSHAGDPLFYPVNGTIDFLAYAIHDVAHKPTAICSPATLSSAQYTFTSMALDFGSKLDGRDGIVISDLCADAPCGQSSTRQSLHFRNAMAKIVFEVRTDETATQERFYINQLTLRNVKTSGVLSVTPSPTVLVDNVLKGSTLSWISVCNYASISLLPTNSSMGVTLDAVAIGDPIYLPPQSETPSDQIVELTYSYCPNTGPMLSPEKITITLKDTNWQPGQQYTYTLTCNLKQIIVECNTAGATLDSTPEVINLDEEYDGKKPV